MKLVQASDDFGYCEVFNLGLKKVMPYGTITHVNLMTDCPGREDAFLYLKDHPEVSIGWHLHWRGTPTADPAKVSSLLDDTGHFKFKDVWNADTFNEEARRRKFDGVKFEEAVIELRAQLDNMIKYSGRVPDFGGGRPGTPVGDAMLKVSEEYGMPDMQETMRKLGTTVTHIHQPGEATYLKRINEDKYISNCTYDPLRYLEEDPQGILQNACSQIAWHCGFLDDYMYTDATYFYEGSRKFFEPSPLADVAMLTGQGFRDWVKKNQVELVSMTDAVYGTRKFQNHLRAIGSDLYIGTIRGDEN